MPSEFLTSTLRESRASYVVLSDCNSNNAVVPLPKRTVFTFVSVFVIIVPTFCKNFLWYKDCFYRNFSLYYSTLSIKRQEKKCFRKVDLCYIPIYTAGTLIPLRSAVPARRWRRFRICRCRFIRVPAAVSITMRDSGGRNPADRSRWCTFSGE